MLVNHTVSPIFLDRAPSATWLCGILYFFVCKIAVPVFLLIMGALLLDKEDTPKRSAGRIVRILIVAVAGSVCYSFYYARQKGLEFNLKEFVQGFLKGPATNAFWYLYLYLALLCLLPVLQRLVKALSKRQLEYVLFLSLGVLGILPLINIFFPSFQVSGYFTSALFGPYIGIVLMGYYIERYLPVTRKTFWCAFCGFVLLIAFQAVGTFLLYQRDSSAYLALDNRVLLTITGSSACFYICVRYIFTMYQLYPVLERIIHYLSDLTFGIYLLGDMMIAQTRPIHAALCQHSHVLLAMVLWELLIFTVCALITAGLRSIKPLRKWI